MFGENFRGDTQAWKFQSWAAFLLSLTLVAIGIIYVPANMWIRGYLFIGVIFLVSSCFALAKTIRDEHESKRLHQRVSDAKTEKILNDYELKSDAG